METKPPYTDTRVALSFALHEEDVPRALWWNSAPITAADKGTGAKRCIIYTHPDLTAALEFWQYIEQHATSTYMRHAAMSAALDFKHQQTHGN